MDGATHTTNKLSQLVLYLTLRLSTPSKVNIVKTDCCCSAVQNWLSEFTRFKLKPKSVHAYFSNSSKSPDYGDFTEMNGFRHKISNAFVVGF